jgi:hypothetical protein
MIERNIYEIIVVNHETGEVLKSKRLTATSSEAAMAKADIKDICSEKGLTPDDVEYAILKLGSLRPIQEIKDAGKVSAF